MKILRRIYYKLFPTYKRLELKYCNYGEADRLIKDNAGKPQCEQWDIAKEEDKNYMLSMVYIERKQRITE